MILPNTYTVALLLAVFSLVCWGSWANAYKLAGRQRFELFYWDWALGVAVAALIAALTFGSLGFDMGGDVGGFAFFDDLMRSSKHSWAYGMAAGAVFNLGTILLVAAMSLAGMSLAFPVGLGLAVVVSLLLDYFLQPHVNAMPLLAAAAVVLGAVVLDTMAYRAVSRLRAQAAIKTGRTKSTKLVVSSKAIVMAAMGGLLIALCFPLADQSRAGETGMGPYAAAFMLAVGVLASTFVYNLFFMNLPVQGEPVELLLYFRQPKKDHLLPLLGGMVWAMGTVSLFVASSATTVAATAATEPVPLLGPAVVVTVGLGATLLSALWGVLVWKEYAGAPGNVRGIVALMLALLVAGLALVLVLPPFA
jgi:glucose uptake protein